MFKRKAAREVPRLVWRMTAENPLGEIVSPSIPRPRPRQTEPGGLHGAGLCDSSLDLRTGVELTETDFGVLPGDLVDELMKSRD